MQWHVYSSEYARFHRLNYNICLLFTRRKSSHKGWEGGGKESGVSDNLPLDMSMNQLGRALEREI